MTESVATKALETIEKADPGQETHGEDNESGKGRRRSHRRRSKSSRQLAKIQRSNKNLKIALTVLIMSFTAMVVVGKQVQTRLQERNQALNEANDQLRLKITEGTSLSQKLLEDMNALVESRLPGLRRLHYDIVIPLAHSYVKNVIFAVSREGDKITYEYRFVFFNPSITPVYPQLSLHLFNDRGIQIGSADVTTNSETSEGRMRSLGPGEIRTYNGSIKIINDSSPAYFLEELG